jgi:hypothetical protein
MRTRRINTHLYPEHEDEREESKRKRVWIKIKMGILRTLNLKLLSRIGMNLLRLRLGIRMSKAAQNSHCIDCS